MTLDLNKRSEVSVPLTHEQIDENWGELEKALAGIATPFMFGAVGDATGSAGVGTDDTAAIQACFDYVEANGGVAKLSGGSFRITDTVHARNIDVDFDGGILYYDGARDRVAFEVGDADGFAVGDGVTRKHIEKIYVRSTGSLDWSDEDYIGVRLSDFSRSFASFNLVYGFTRNVELYSRNSFCAYNSFYGGEFLDGKYQWTLTCDGGEVGANEFCNENNFYGGRYGCTSAANALGDAYGVHFRALNSGYAGHNSNKWYGSCFELASGSPGDEREPFRFDDCGGSNHGRDLRWEDGRGYFGQCIGTTVEISKNSFDIGYFSDGGGSIMTPAFLNTGLAKANEVKTFWYDLDRNAHVSFDFNQLVSAYSATQAAVRGGLCSLTSASADGALFQTSILGRKDSVRIGTNRGIGFHVTCLGGEQFVLSSECEVGFYGRLGVALYDANGARLTNVSANAPHLISIAGASVSWSASYGGLYVTGTDGGTLVFQISSEVKAIRVSIHPGTAVAYAKTLSITRIGGYNNNRPIHTYSGLDHDIFARMATDPTAGIIGRYGIGDIIHNAAAASAAASYWQCITAGRLASAWTAATAYAVGDLRLNDTNKIYICTVAGTSAGSGGPTGTGTGITDNTVTWDYLGPKAVFTAGPSLP